MTLRNTQKRRRNHKIKDGHLLYDAGKTEDHPHARGVAFLINKKIKDNI